MTTAASDWSLLCSQFNKFSNRIDQSSSININSHTLRSEANEISRFYFGSAKQALSSDVDEQLITLLDDAFGNLLTLSEGRNAKTSYKKELKRIRKAIPSVNRNMAVNSAAVRRNEGATEEDIRILKTLRGLVPSAARSYEQAIRDLADNHRISFRGPALELRECLRETLDHLAPDADVLGSEGFALEKGRNGPTIKQKVRFILKARGRSKDASKAPEQSSETVEEMVSALTRTIYDRSSAATHVATERKKVDQVRRYIAAILHDILEQVP